MKKEFEVNFLLHSNLYIDAENADEAREVVNKMINDKINVIEEILYGVPLYDDDYTEDVVEL